MHNPLNHSPPAGSPVNLKVTCRLDGYKYKMKCHIKQLNRRPNLKNCQVIPTERVVRNNQVTARVLVCLTRAEPASINVSLRSSLFLGH